MSKPRIKKIGISGKIGSGKSLAIKFFKKNKYPAYDLDKISREIMNPGQSCYKKIVKYFGPEILYKNKNLNRNKIKKIIFNDEIKRKKLNSIVHPEIFNKVKYYVKLHESKNDYIVFFEGALITKETKIGIFLDQIIYIKSSKNNIINRVKRRDNIAEKEIFNILRIQKSIEHQVKSYDYIVHNNTKIRAFEDKLNSILEKISL